jgi:selenocysteine-specific elongation factor
VEPVAPKRKRATDACRESFRTLLDGSPENSFAAATELAGFAGLPGERIPIILPHGRLEGHALDRHGFRAGNRLFHPDLVDKARASILQTIAGFHERNPLAPGILRESLRHSLPPHAPVALADAVTDSLVRQGTVIVEATTARMPAFHPRLAPGQQKAADALEALFRDAGLATPGRDEIPSPLANRPDLDDLLHFLQRAGRLIPIATGRWLHPASLETAIALARTRFGEGTDLGPADFRDLFGISRKYLIPLLEHLDRTGVTTRIGDSRRLEPSVPD